MTESVVEHKHRKIIAFSIYVSHLKPIYKILKEKGYSVGLFIGEKNKKAREEALTHDIILATYGIAGEGTDLPNLNCAIFITPPQPISNIIQPLGRIQRTLNPKEPPLVLDIIDNLDFFYNNGIKRNKKYNSFNYKQELYYANEDKITKGTMHKYKNKLFIELPKSAIQEEDFSD